MEQTEELMVTEEQAKYLYYLLKNAEPIYSDVEAIINQTLKVKLQNLPLHLD